MERMDPRALERLSYGMFLLTAQEGGRDNGCIINTAEQVTVAPDRVIIAVNRSSLTCQMIEHTGQFTLSVLSVAAGFEIYRHFGMQSGHQTEKCTGRKDLIRAENGLYHLTGGSACAMLSGAVEQMFDADTHRLFLARVTEMQVLSAEAPATYAFYHENVKPKKSGAQEKTGWRCRVCDYVFEGKELPADYICPICGHGAADFEPV